MINLQKIHHAFYRQIVIFRSDIKDLAKLFDQFGDSQMIGIANDLTPHYWKRYIMVNWSIICSLTSDFWFRDILCKVLNQLLIIFSTEDYRKRNPTTSVGAAGLFQVEKLLKMKMFSHSKADTK